MPYHAMLPGLPCPALLSCVQGVPTGRPMPAKLQLLSSVDCTAPLQPTSAKLYRLPRGNQAYSTVPHVQGTCQFPLTAAMCTTQYWSRSGAAYSLQATASSTAAPYSVPHCASLCWQIVQRERRVCWDAPPCLCHINMCTATART